jgi:cystathionine beta-lyase/cystathionine gamma-synthase
MYNPTQPREELHYLLSDADKRLALCVTTLGKTKKHIDPQTYTTIIETAKRYRQDIASHIQQLKTNNPTAIKSTREYLRTHLVLIGALITSTDWQSPSYDATTQSEAGRQTGTIHATINDYKRDQHWDTYHYEQAFLKEHIDALIKLPLHVHATSSGMAAFTTILAYLSGENHMKGPILCGSSIYFQNKWLLLQSYADKLVFSDESNTQAFIDAIETHTPSVIFLDSITNAPDVVVADIPSIIQHLMKTKRNIHLVVDNTGLSVQLQPFPLLLGRATKLNLILFESLNKYHQFGMDRINGGMIVGFGSKTAAIFDYRVHSGTILSDVAAASLPTPNRTQLTHRIERHTHNTRLIVAALRAWIKTHQHSPITDISYPGMGCYFTVQFTPAHATVPSFKRFVAHCTRVAKKRNVPLVSGTSFGLNITRIYLTALRSKPHAPFVRIAVGTEDAQTIDRLIHTFIETFEQFS